MSAGQAAYERDLAKQPLYHDGTPRPAWSALWPVARWSWERDPTPLEDFPFYVKECARPEVCTLYRESAQS